MTEVKKFRIKCLTEDAYVYTWVEGETVPTQCPNNTAHSIDPDSVVIVETVQDNVVKIDASQNTIKIADFRDLTGKNLYRKGFSYTTVPGNDNANIFSEKFNCNLLIQGGGYHVVSGATPDDNIDINVIDIDNVLGFGPDVLLKKFVDTEFVATGDRLDLMVDDAAMIPAGVYVQVVYRSQGAEAVKFHMHYNFRTCP